MQSILEVDCSKHVDIIRVHDSDSTAAPHEVQMQISWDLTQQHEQADWRRDAVCETAQASLSTGATALYENAPAAGLALQSHGEVLW